jgi:hypothetical protein
MPTAAGHIYRHDDFQRPTAHGRLISLLLPEYLISIAHMSTLPEAITMTQFGYTVVRIIHFPNPRLPPGEEVELIGVEKPTMTPVLSITEGCKVSLS